LAVFKRTAIAAGFAAVIDPLAYLIDLGTALQVGLTGTAGGASWHSDDGLHPNRLGQIEVTGLLAQAIQARLSGDQFSASGMRGGLNG